VIPKTERDELRRIVRGDFKALKEEITVRQAELEADIEKRIATRFMAHESVLTTTSLKIREIVENANLAIAAAAAECQRECEGYDVRFLPLTVASVRLVREKRDELRRAMLADLEARVAQAKAKMGRQEIDLLKRLSVEALESGEAKAFLAEIPKVSELVPASRLAELEAEFDSSQKDGSTS
jgi:hypothetical protein